MKVFFPPIEWSQNWALTLAVSLILPSLGSCGTQAVNQRKPPPGGKAGANSDQSASDRSNGAAEDSAPQDDLGEEAVINAPGDSDVSGTKIAGRFGSAAPSGVSVDEAIAVGTDVLGAYLQVPPSEVAVLSRPIYAEFPADPDGKRTIRLQIPVAPIYLTGSFDDDHSFETAPQIGVVSVIRKDTQKYEMEAFRSGGKLKISEDGSSFLVRVHHGGTFQVVRLRNSLFPEKSVPTNQEPRRKR